MDIGSCTFTFTLKCVPFHDAYRFDRRSVCMYTSITRSEKKADVARSIQLKGHSMPSPKDLRSDRISDNFTWEFPRNKHLHSFFETRSHG